ncbi:hypothetical protein N658DRAFT_493514 [Parathielavia hyrcaniae]|uniref:Uncharacterized protein n=1 Tax=Parathielavia hyrcaniae TaxID=113614 RepID=A0AAN6T4R5_9PEZI|nr:hypothetical protein N658DRAFT_493514 [Parathielavia hyrcaniae]
MNSAPSPTKPDPSSPSPYNGSITSSTANRGSPRTDRTKNPPGCSTDSTPTARTPPPTRPRALALLGPPSIGMIRPGIRV